MFGAGMPLAAGPMFRNLGIGRGSSILGGVSCAFIPLPILLYKVSKMAGRDRKARISYTDVLLAALFPVWSVVEVKVQVRYVVNAANASKGYLPEILICCHDGLFQLFPYRHQTQ